MDEVFQKIGKILTNLQALEFALRLFLYELQKTVNSLGTNLFDLKSLKVGEWIPETPLSNYDTLGQLIKKVNIELKLRGFSSQIDPSIVGLRDALVHGRVLSLRPEGPFSILKFSKANSGKVKVVLATEMTGDWFKQQINITITEINKVIKITRDLGLTCFPDE